MALDHALLRRAAATGEAVLRVYSWTAPTLSLGRHQPARGVFDLQASRALGVDLVRRPTGGRAVLHHREVTYSVTAPLTAATPDGPRPRTRGIYAAINGLLLDALQALGAPVALAPPERGTTLHPGLADLSLPSPFDPLPSRRPRPLAVADFPCFDQATEGEIVAGSQKLAGSAQWREGRAVLQHGSILIDDDQKLISLVAADVPLTRVATLRELLHREVQIEEVASALEEALDATLARAGRPPSTPLELDPETADAARALRRQYADDAWTWRH